MNVLWKTEYRFPYLGRGAAGGASTRFTFAHTINMVFLCERWSKVTRKKYSQRSTVRLPDKGRVKQISHKMSCFYPGSISVDYTRTLQIWLPILTLTFFAAMPILTDTGMSWDVRQFSVVPHISNNGARDVFRFGCHAPVPHGMPGDGKRPRRAPACS